jgi:hypothetical protein
MRKVERREEKERRKDRSKLTNEWRPGKKYRRFAVTYFRIFQRIECAFAFRQWFKASAIASCNIQHIFTTFKINYGFHRPFRK